MTLVPGMVFYLLGFAGVGKLTIAREITAKTGARIVDNHHINNPIFELIQADGVSKLPAEVWDRVLEVRHAVLETVATLSPPEWSFVFTNDFTEKPENHAVFNEVVEVAGRRGSLMVPVRLLCEPGELARRIVNPTRRERMKSINAEQALERARTWEVLNPDHPNTFTVDVTHLSPVEAASLILEHARNLGG